MVNNFTIDGKHPKIKIFLNNNSKCHVTLENIIKGEKWDLTNVPSITIIGSNFDNKKKTIAVIFENRTIAEEEITIADHSFIKTIEIPAPLENPKEIGIKVGTDFYEKISVEQKQLYGRITYFDGTPVAYPIIIACSWLPVEGGLYMIAVGDEEGNYRISVCNELKSIAFLEKGYSKTILECWLWDVDLKEDIRIDGKIDKLEVYQLHAWRVERGYSYIHFVPMSLTRHLEFFKKGIRNKVAIVSNPEAHPHLKIDDVAVFIEEEEVPILTFDEHNDLCGFPFNEQKIVFPSYLLSVASPKDLAGKIVKVQIKNTVQVDKKEILERGEGYFLGFLKWPY